MSVEKVVWTGRGEPFPLARRAGFGAGMTPLGACFWAAQHFSWFAKYEDAEQVDQPHGRDGIHFGGRGVCRGDDPRMTTCIVLDGWHKGETLILNGAPSTIRLYRPPVVTTCYCNPDSYYESGATTEKVDVLQLAFRSVDGEVALYSTDGKSHHILAREWVARADDALGFFYKPQALLYVGCRDHRAWPVGAKGDANE